MNSHAGVRLPNLFGDHMVLQAGKEVPVWGWGTPREEVTVSFAGHSVMVEVDAKGEWSTKLPAIKKSFDGRELMVSSKSGRRTLQDVLVGEVWVCGGQSNMEWTLRSTRDADLEMLSVNHPEIRFIRLPKVARFEPQKNFPVESPTKPEGNWRLCVPEQAENCTAVGYYFARRLRRVLDAPVGLIDISWGGTMAQHWATKETLRPIPAMKPYFDKFETARNDWISGGREEGAKKRYAADLKNWEKARVDAKAKGEREPRRPNSKAYENPDHKAQPGGMMNGMTIPISRAAVRGVLFYQGENNSFTVGWKPYPRTCPAVISDWRKVFGQPDLPFGIIQIAGWSNRRSMTYDMNHHASIVREIQFLTWKRTKNTGLVATYDTNTSGGIHPQRKLPVGERSARWALAEVYGMQGYGKRPIEWRGPVYESMEVKDGKVAVRFEKDTARGLLLDQDVEVGFYLAGKDREFHHARARVDKGAYSVIVWSDDVAEPVTVRYGWSNLPAGGLMNARELPAYPFRSDEWPMTPHQSTGSYDVTAPDSLSE
ncbi:sialate O-acetylesterase [Opitutales bacterium]|nr:sialate O-acetylesterase [Opitutales bacterium]